MTVKKPSATQVPGTREGQLGFLATPVPSEGVAFHSASSAPSDNGPTSHQQFLLHLLPLVIRLTES